MPIVENGQTIPVGQYQSFLASMQQQIAGTITTGTPHNTTPGNNDPSTPGGIVWPSTKTNLSGYHYTSSHHGIDIGQKTGDPILAPFSGTVVFAGWDNTGYGNLVVIKDAAGRYRSYEAHLSEVYVKPGEVVTAGMIVGAAGSTGNSTGPHLHFELRNANGTGYINPYAVFGNAPEPGQVVGGTPLTNVMSGTQNQQTGSAFLAPAPVGVGNQTGTGPLDDPLGTRGVFDEIKSFFSRVKWTNIAAVLIGLAVAGLAVAVVVKSEGQAAVGKLIGEGVGSAIAEAV
jgi:murein DD-endopeptidase MepM/ murein hydrolase activator NlpD